MEIFEYNQAFDMAYINESYDAICMEGFISKAYDMVRKFVLTIIDKLGSILKWFANKIKNVFKTIGNKIKAFYTKYIASKESFDQVGHGRYNVEKDIFGDTKCFSFSQIVVFSHAAIKGVRQIRHVINASCNDGSIATKKLTEYANVDPKHFESGDNDSDEFNFIEEHPSNKETIKQQFYRSHQTQQINDRWFIEQCKFIKDGNYEKLLSDLDNQIKQLDEMRESLKGIFNSSKESDKRLRTLSEIPRIKNKPGFDDMKARNTEQNKIIQFNCRVLATATSNVQTTIEVCMLFMMDTCKHIERISSRI